MDMRELASVLDELGCPSEKTLAMAAQLDKRARQLRDERGQTYENALAHLLGLMRQGWAAKGMTNDPRLKRQGGDVEK
jgi:hypothetical protein